MFSVIKKQIEKYNEAKKKEGFSSVSFILDMYMAYIIIIIVLSLLAIYLSFKCNKGLNIIDLFFAVFCMPCYLFYRLVLGCNND
jgi:hypothetical protein